MSPTAGARQLHLSIGSRFDNIELVQHAIDDALLAAGTSEDTRHWIGLAIREAVANAIKHGNLQDPRKAVDVDAEIGAGEIVIRVADRGHGFDPGGVRDPLAPENRFRAGGRGIFYMRKLMDDVDFSFRPAGGTLVTMRKRLSAAENAPSS